MNRFFLLFFFSIILTIPGTDELHAQRFEGGLRGSLVASEVSGDNLGGPNKLGWSASAFTFTPLSEYSSIMLELMYIQKGSRSVPNERNNFYEYRLFLQYIEIPLHYRMDIARYTSNVFFEQLIFSAGLSVSFLVDHEETDDGTPVPPDEREDFHPAELNILLGIAYPISQALHFNFGFSNSLTPIRPHAGGGKLWYNRGQYNTLWHFGLAYTIW